MSDVSPMKFDLERPSEKQLQVLIDGLSAEERRVMLNHGDEAPFCGVFLTEKRDGIYGCRLCGLPLFRGGAKFESGTGWPSFTAGAVGQQRPQIAQQLGFGRCALKHDLPPVDERLRSAKQERTVAVLEYGIELFECPFGQRLGRPVELRQSTA